MEKRALEMTSKERMEALYDREPTDTIVYVHRGYGFCAKNVGFAIADIYEHPQKSFEAQMRTIEQYESDGTPFYTFVSYGAWEFGGTIEWPEDRWGSGPGVETRPVVKAEDVFELELPEVKTAGAIPKMMEFAKLQEQEGVQIAFICGSPFTFAANLCGVQEFLSWVVESPDAVHHAMRLMTDHLLEVAEYFIDTFGKGRLLARSAAPTDGLVSVRMFDEFALPYIKELHTKILEMGASSIYCHICGEQNHLLERWAEVPFGDPGMLSFGHEVDILRAAEVFPEHIIAGNVEPAIISRGTPEEVYEGCRQAIEKGKQCPSGYVLMGGCELPATTPPYHIYLMSKARREFGWLD
jgi:uroporphyrinogen decarboxylase